MLVNTYYAKAIVIQGYSEAIIGELSLLLDRIIEIIQKLKIEDDFNSGRIHFLTINVGRNSLTYNTFVKQLKSRIGKTIYLEDAIKLYNDNEELAKDVIEFYNNLFSEIHTLDLNEKLTNIVKKEEKIIKKSIKNFNTLNSILKSYLSKESV